MAPGHGGLVFWDYLVVVAYMLWMLGIGFYYARRQKNTNEYFLGGKSMNWFLVGVSTMATLVSTITYLATPGEIVAKGFGILWSQVPMYLALPIICYIIIPKIMRQNNIVSGYQLLEKQFGLDIRKAAAILFVLTRIAWTSLVVYTCSRAISTMTGWPLELIIVVVGVITTSYTSIGGIRAVIITDVTQAFVLFGGALGVVGFAMFAAHSFTGWWPDFHSAKLMTALNWPKVPIFSTDLTVRITITGIIFQYFVFWLATASSDQLAIQRYLSTKNVAAARKSFVTNILANTAVSITLILAGIALLGFFLHNLDKLPAVSEMIANQKKADIAKTASEIAAMPAFQGKVQTMVRGGDNLFPWFITHIMPAGLSGVLLAALFSAAMSSVSSGVSSISTVLMVDFDKTFAAGIFDENGKVRRAKMMGVVIGVLAIAVAFLINFIQGNFMEVAQKVNGFFAGPLAALFLMAFFMRRVNRQGAWAAIIVGFLVGVVTSYYREITAFLSHGQHVVVLSFMYIMPFTLIISMLAGYIVSLFFPKPKLEPEMVEESKTPEAV